MPNASAVESSWLKRQVETHLLFGFFARRMSLYPFLIALAVAIIPFDLLLTGSLHLNSLSIAFSFGFAAFYSRKLSRYRLAAICWAVFKSIQAFIALMLMTVATFASLAAGRSDALPNFLLGLIWIPSLEFVPRFTPKQQYITLVRLVLSIPIIWMGVASGDWHWN